MLKTNITVTIALLENNIEESQIDFKSSDDRSKIVLEPRAGKLVLDTEEVLQAIAMVKKFSADNPIVTEQPLVQSSVEAIPVMSLDEIKIDEGIEI